jgi:predicted  nucleic acid-binding Zn-ribbon protein
MGRVVGVSAVLFVVAVGFIVLTQGPEMAALIGAFRSQSPLHKIAWAVIVLVPLLMLPVAAWLWDRLLRQRRAGGALELRLDGMRARVKDMGKAQADLDADAQQLTRSDPEDAIAALQRRVTEAERFTEIQQSRNQMINLEARVDAIRTQQQVLKDRIAPTLDTRHSIEQMFAELDSRQADLERALAEVASGDDGTALEIRLKNLTEFARQSIARCDQIEHASKTVASLKEAGVELIGRLAPFAAAEDGITSRVRELSQQRDEIAAAIDLASGDNGTALDVRLKELTEFARQGVTRCDQIGHASKTMAALKEACTDLVGRLAPFLAAEGGIPSRLRELNAQRDEIATAIGSLERTPDGALADRLQNLTDDKRKLEGSVGQLHEQFFNLANLRKDVSGLFAAIDRALNTVTAGKNGGGAADIDGRIDELSRFIEQTQNQFDSIEGRVLVLGQLKGRLGELQSRLVPLESSDTGVAKLVEELETIREKLVVKVRNIEGGEEGELAARVKTFAEAKRELEERVAALADQFTKLSSLRKDIAGLFDKLSSAVTASSH